MRRVLFLPLILVLISFLGVIDASESDWVNEGVPEVKVQFEILLIDLSKPRGDPAAQVSISEYCATESCGLLHPVRIEHTISADTKVSEVLSLLFKTFKDTPHSEKYAVKWAKKARLLATTSGESLIFIDCVSYFEAKGIGVEMLPFFRLVLEITLPEVKRQEEVHAGEARRRLRSILKLGVVAKSIAEKPSAQTDEAKVDSLLERLVQQSGAVAACSEASLRLEGCVRQIEAKALEDPPKDNAADDDTMQG